MKTKSKVSIPGFVLSLLLSGCSHSALAPAPAPEIKDAATAELRSLSLGNDRFIHGNPSHPDQDPSRRIALVEGQYPKAVVLSCSDSRVPPELVFDQGLGDLFVVRVAGNVADSGAIASIEYAVEHFGPQLLVLMGHDSCGAVKAAVTTPEGQSAGSPDLDRLVSEIQKNLARENKGLSSKDPSLHREAVANVDAVEEDLMQRSSLIRERVRQGKLHIARAVYRMSSGKVDFWDKAP